MSIQPATKISLSKFKKQLITAKMNVITDSPVVVFFNFDLSTHTKQVTESPGRTVGITKFAYRYIERFNVIQNLKFPLKLKVYDEVSYFKDDFKSPNASLDTVIVKHGNIYYKAVKSKKILFSYNVKNTAFLLNFLLKDSLKLDVIVQCAEVKLGDNKVEGTSTNV